MSGIAELPATEIPPDAITFWVIYDHPDDHPGHWVLRPQFSVMADVERPDQYGTVTERFGRAVTIVSNRIWLRDTLDEARALVPPGCNKFDDPNPKIAEVWMQ